MHYNISKIMLSLLPHQFREIGVSLQISIDTGEQCETIGPNRFILCHDHNGVEESGNRFFESTQQGQGTFAVSDLRCKDDNRRESRSKLRTACLLPFP